MKKKRGVFLIVVMCFLLVSSLTAYAAGGCAETEIVSIPSPRFEIEFDETTRIVDAEFKGKKAYTLTGPTVKDFPLNTTFEYGVIVDEPGSILPSGAYRLTLRVEDIFGNPGQVVKCYNLQINPIQLELEEPSYGVSSNKTFTVKINSDAFAVCKYSFNVPLNFIGGMSSFDQTTLSTVHTKQFTIDEHEMYTLFVKCNRSDGVLNEGGADGPRKFNLTVDTTRPAITRFYVLPSNNNEIVDKAALTDMFVDTDDKTRCKFSVDKADIGEMENSFAGYSAETFLTTNRFRLSNLVDNTTYKYVIVCENEAELLSEPANYSFRVNFKAAESVQIKKPGRYASESPVVLEAVTNKKAQCKYSSDPAIFSDSLISDEDQYVHTANLQGLTSQGEFTYYVQCTFLETGTKVKEPVTFIIDKTAPKIMNITGQNTCRENELSAKWAGSDELSGIEGYEYRIESGSAIVLDWTATTETSAIYKGSNLSTATGYRFKVKAKDKAGNWGIVIASKSPIAPSDPTATNCLEKVPPKGDISAKYEAGGLKVTLLCSDTGSGCNIDNQYYGKSETGVCSASLKYAGPVTLTDNAVFCWKVADMAGNTAEGKRELTLTKDTDKDGVPDGGDACQNTPTGETVDSKGCSESQRDTDNDGIFDSSDKCPDTPSEAEVGPDGCALDSDNDGMPDYWEEKYGLNPEDPSDADEDLDEDGISNLDEFKDGTDPTDETDPGGDVGGIEDNDEDEDGVLDDDDKCPDTPSGATVDEDGCSDEQSDADGDGMSDDWEKRYCPDDNCEPGDDLDNDGLSNLEEYKYCLNNNCRYAPLKPTEADTDSDGVNDGKEVEDGTDPTDSDSFKKSKLLQIILLIFGLLFILGGAGYLFYKKFLIQTPSSMQPTMRRVSVTQPAQIQVQKGKAQPTTQPGQLVQRITTSKPIAKPTLTPAQKRRMELKKMLETRRNVKFKERGTFFEKFAGGAEEETIHRIALPERKVKIVEKPAIPQPKVETKLEKKLEIKEEVKVPEPLIKRIPEFKKVQDLVDKKSEFGKLAALTTLQKTDLRKLFDSKDQMGAKKIFKELDSINRGKPKEKRVMAFGELSNLIGGRADLKEKDIFKELPSKLVPETHKEAQAFNKLANLVSDKKVSFEDLSKLSSIKSKEATLEYISKLAKKEKKK